MGIDGSGSVTNIELEDHRIAFDTTAVGVPHMIKVSYFPNWQARGAEGPFRAAPSFMVVIPTEEHVEIVFSDRLPEIAGKVVTGLTIAGLIGVAVWRRRSAAETAQA